MTFVLCRPFGILVVLVSLFSGCHRTRTAEQQDYVESLKNHAAEVQKSGTPLTVDIGSITTFEWDEMHVFQAYSWPQEVQRRLGFPWLDGAKSATNYQDQYQLLVFTRGRSVVSWSDFEVRTARFYVGESPILRQEASLTLQEARGRVAVTRLGEPVPEVRFFRHGENGNVEVVSHEEMEKAFRQREREEIELIKESRIPGE